MIVINAQHLSLPSFQEPFAPEVKGRLQWGFSEEGECKSSAKRGNKRAWLSRKRRTCNPEKQVWYLQATVCHKDSEKEQKVHHSVQLLR